VKGETVMKATAGMRRLYPLRAIGAGMCLLERDRFLAVLEVTPVGFALRSERERQALVLQFTNFLNGLAFPIQIMVRTDRLRLDEYLAEVKAQEGQLEPHLRPALADYLRFLQESATGEHLLRRRFFLVLSWQGVDSRSRPLKRGEVLWDEAQMELSRREASIAEGIRPLGVRVRRLPTEDLYDFVFSALATPEHQEEVSWSWDVAPWPEGDR
jgi:hypothetical protein